MKEKQKKHVTHNPQPKTEVAKPTKASRKRLAPEVAPPIVAETTVAAGVTALGGSPATDPKVLPSLIGGASIVGVSSGSSSPASTATTSTADPSSSVALADVIDGPPDVTLPTVPPGFLPLTKGAATMATRLTSAVYHVLPAVLRDLQGGAALSSILGPSAPEASVATAQVTAGINWRAMRIASEAWATYAKDADITVWNETMTSLDAINTRFEAALALDPTLTKTYPGLTALMSALKATGKASGASRKRNYAKARAVAQSKAASAATQGAEAGSAQGSSAKVTIST